MSGWVLAKIVRLFFRIGSLRGQNWKKQDFLNFDNFLNFNFWPKYVVINGQLLNTSSLEIINAQVEPIPPRV